MAVSTACSGTIRWRALGRAGDILCPLHRRQLAVLPGPTRRVASCSPSTHRRPHGGLGPTYSTSRSLASDLTARRSVATAAAHHVALLAAVTTSSSSSAAAAAALAASGLPPALVAFVALLPSIGTFLICVAGALFLLSSLPLLWALARTTHRAERLLAALESELPDTVASLRLAGLEVTDCIQELGALGGEVTRGVRSTAALATAAEAGVRNGVAAADSVMRNRVVPAVASAEKNTRDAVENHLVATSRLSYSASIATEAAAATKTAARRLRAGLAVGGLVGAAVQAGRYARESLLRQQEEEEQQQQQQAKRQRHEEEERALRQQLQALQAKQRQQQQQRKQQGQTGLEA